MNYSAFVDQQLYAQGELIDVVSKVKLAFPSQEALLVETETCARLDINWHGSLDEVLERLKINAHERAKTESEDVPSTTTPAKMGRPKLGVVAKEVTLLPRH